ncbi:MAG: MarR family winged helix-turn-helix transcriptional regulator [Shimia sp.]
MSERNETGGAGGAQLFALLREVGIISQLSTALFLKRLPEGLHPSHFALLSNLTRLGDGKTPQALAAAFQVPKATMTNTLQVLEKRAMIRIVPNPDDKRSKLVTITPAGRAFHEEAIGALIPALDHIAQEVDGFDIPRTIEQLQKLRIYLDENRSL